LRILVVILSIFSISLPVIAQTIQSTQSNKGFTHNNNHVSTSETVFNASFPNFPTPQELEQMTPPEPMTAEKITQQFSLHRKNLHKAIEEDKKAADKYARDFARYQQHQAKLLKTILDNASKQRLLAIQRLNQREEQAMAHFIKNQQETTNNK